MAYDPPSIGPLPDITTLVLHHHGPVLVGRDVRQQRRVATPTIGPDQGGWRCKPQPRERGVGPLPPHLPPGQCPQGPDDARCPPLEAAACPRRSRRGAAAHRARGRDSPTLWQTHVHQGVCKGLLRGPPERAAHELACAGEARGTSARGVVLPHSLVVERGAWAP
jgi:hypothetical protein